MLTATFHGSHLSCSGVVLFSVELMCASGGGQVSRNTACKRLGRERPVVGRRDHWAGVAISDAALPHRGRIPRR